MQVCGNCGKAYDESEYSKCPDCHPEENNSKINIVYDDKTGQVQELTDEEYEEFKKTHPDYN